MLCVLLASNAHQQLRWSWPNSRPLGKRMRSGDRPGLQNRRVADNPVTGGFDPHSLPPIYFH